MNNSRIVLFAMFSSRWVLLRISLSLSIFTKVDWKKGLPLQTESNTHDRKRGGSPRRYWPIRDAAAWSARRWLVNSALNDSPKVWPISKNWLVKNSSLCWAQVPSRKLVITQSLTVTAERTTFEWFRGKRGGGNYETYIHQGLDVSTVISRSSKNLRRLTKGLLFWGY